MAQKRPGDAAKRFMELVERAQIKRAAVCSAPQQAELPVRREARVKSWLLRKVLSPAAPSQDRW